MITSAGHAQSLSSGAIAFIGFNGDSDDDFAIVALADIPVNTTIYFTDSEWNGSSFESGEDDITWMTGSSVITAGTVITFTDINSANEMVSIGSISAGNMNLGVSNEAIFAYVGAERSPTTFLAAVATSVDQYDGSAPDPQGTLDGTGLSEGSTAILLADNIDVAQYIGDRSGNTQNGYLTLLNDIKGETATDDHWEQTGGSGDQDGQILLFNTQTFIIVEPPTLAFSASKATASEDDGSVTLTVELIEADNTDVEVDIVFLAGSSNADASDIDNYTTQTVSFNSGAASGETRNVTVNLINDMNVEEDEIAVFQLQNNTAGSIINPGILNLTITDDDAPAILINEIHADPDGTNGDADGNDTVDSSDDEFIEFVNTTSSDIDISGWQVFDDPVLDLRHTFPDGTVIPASGALVLFGDDNVNPQGSFGGAVVQSSNESATLSLNNGGDTITLQDDDGNEVLSVTYPDAGDDQSINLDPELNTSSNYSNHSTVSGSGTAIFSPGTRVDGTTFGNGTYAIGIRGNEGWRFISTPTQNTKFDDLFANLWTQGATGSDAASEVANIYNWQEPGGGAFTSVSDMNTELNSGKGYIVYVYEDDDFRTPGVQGGFPKVINTDAPQNSSPVSVAVTSNDAGGAAGIDGDEGYNLLGNPYGTDISVDGVIQALIDVDPGVTASDVNANVYVWNHALPGGADYEMLGSGETIAPFQAFFIRYKTDGVDGTVNFSRSDLAANQGAEFYKTPASEINKFELQLGNGDKFDTYEVEFREEGAVGEDRYDGYKLFSLNSNSIGLYSTTGDGVKLAKNALPDFKSLEGELRIPLGFDLPASGGYTFSWNNLNDIPEEMGVYIVDNETNRRVDLRSSQELSFNSVVSDTKTEARKSNLSPIITSTNSEASPRFDLLIIASKNTAGTNKELEKMVEVSPNYPNPFRAQTTMDLKLKEKMHVKMTIWNIVGQKIATICDEMMDQGEHPMTWNITANMPSGIYICKVEAGGKVLTRKMTLVK